MFARFIYFLICACLLLSFDINAQQQAGKIVAIDTLSGFEYFESIAVKSNNELVLGNYSFSTSPSGVYNIYLFDSAGKIIWHKIAGDTIKSSDSVYFRANTISNHTVVPTIDNGYLFLGINHFAWWGGIPVTKMDSAGNINWIKDVKGGGNTDVLGWDMIETSSGNICISGTIYHDDSAGNYQQDVFVAMLNKEGDTLWTNYYGDKDTTNMETGCRIGEINNNEFIVLASNFNLATMNDDSYKLIKFDSTGKLIWLKKYMVNISWGDELERLLTDKDGNILVAHPADTVYRDKWDTSAMLSYIAKIDTQGDIIWENYFGADDGGYNNNVKAYGLVEAPDGGYILLDHLVYWYKNYPIKNYYIRLIKVDKDGQLLWKRKFFSTDTSFMAAYGYALDAYSSGVIDDFLEITSNGKLVTVVWLDSTVVKTKQTYRVRNLLIITDESGCIYYPKAGFKSGTVNIALGDTIYFTDSSKAMPEDSITSWLWDFGDGNTSTNQNPSHVYSQPDTFTVKLIVYNVNGCTDTLVKKNLIIVNDTATYIKNFYYKNIEHLQITPNPFNQSTTISYFIDKPSPNSNLSVFDVTGKMVKSFKLSESNNNINISASEFNSGIYYCKLIINGIPQDGGKMVVVK